MKEYPRGSEWRIWDLQVQTILDDGYKSLEGFYVELKEKNENKWNRYIAEIGGEENALKFDSKDYFYNTSLSESDRCSNYVRNFLLFLSVFRDDLGLIGITDHNYFHSTLIDTFHEYSKRLEIKVICGVEINASGVHMLVYFDGIPYKKSNMSEGIKTFLSKIDVENPKTNEVLTVSSKSVINVVDEINKQKGLYIFPHCNSDNGLFQERGRTDRTHLSDTYNYKPYILLQAKNKNSADQTLGYICSNPILFKSTPIFTISNDSRCLKEIGTCDSNNNFTWIKADPTFEGLKQIVFENDERVKIHPHCPQQDYPKPYFSEVKINYTEIFGDGTVKFSSKELILNPNLVAIIGGRGTGKSLLLDSIAKTFNKFKKNDRADKITIESNNFKVVFTKNDNEHIEYNIQHENYLDYLHIQQGEVKDIADPDNPEKLDAEIKDLLKLPSLDELQISSPDSTIERLINEIFEIKDWFSQRDEYKNLVNSPEFNESKKKEKMDLINIITTQQTKQKISQYIENLNKINSETHHKIIAEKLNNTLTFLQSENNAEIGELNKLINDNMKKIPLINFEVQLEAIKYFIEEKNKEISNLKIFNDNIEISFEEAGIEGDISTLLEQIEIYQSEINNFNRKIEEAKFKQEELIKKFNQIGEIANSFVTIHKNYIQKIKENWEQLKSGKENWNTEQKELINKLLYDIEIEAKEKFNPDTFYKIISEDCLNLQKFRGTQSQSKEERIRQTFDIKDQNDFISFLKGEKLIELGESRIELSELLDSDIFIRNGARDFLRLCLLSKYREQFWKVYSISKYKNKETHQLSVGQRGTFYLCLKLATDPFSKPFVFDQPEDDLDNDFIMHHLVPIFKKIKKYRQVIIVTHNANLVVNADAEQVIVAESKDEVLSYESGAIENPVIREQICNILEGGEPAFTMREKKYGFVNI